MVFSSLLFLFRFLPIVLLCYFVTPRRYRNLILFIGSLMFYAWGEPVYVVLLLTSSVLDYFMGLWIGNARLNEHEKQAKIALICSLAGNLSLLGVFKYADFFIGTINGVAGTDIQLLELALPIGISFYTFQTLSYTIDVYRGEVAPQKNFITFGAYVSLFPQLIAGPIVRYQTVEQELSTRSENLDDFSEGVLRFVNGLAKKVLIANNVGAIFSEIAVMSGSELSTMTAWLGVVAFAFQIYFDFSGYSDMAIGLGKMFGFHFLENFDYPYESKSITEFWRRWHISLGTWFREYVYIPLGGNRKGMARQILNIAIVWFLTGFWHGASWNFVLWGVYYGAILIMEKLFLLKWLEKLPSAVGHVYTVLLVVIGWAFFSYADVAHGSDFVMALLGQAQNGFIDSQCLYILLGNAVLLVIAAVGSTSLPKNLAKRAVGGKNVVYEIATGIFVAVCMLLCVAFLVSDSYNPFLYFRF